MAPYFVHRFLPKRSRDARFAAVFDGLLYEYSFVTSSTMVESMISPW